MPFQLFLMLHFIYFISKTLLERIFGPLASSKSASKSKMQRGLNFRK